MPAATPQLLAASKPIRGGVGAAAACAEKKLYHQSLLVAGGISRPNKCRSKN